jgi:hypothetical protein
MDVKIAAAACRDSVEKSSAPDTNGEFGKDHLYAMIDKIESGEVAGEKAHRWLGYLQGVLVATGGTTLEEMKLVNVRA